MTSPDTAEKSSRAPGKKKSAKKPKAPAPLPVFDQARARTQSDFVILAGTDGVILWANPATEQALGYAWQEMAQTPLLAYIAPEYRETMMVNIGAVMKKKEPPFHETVLAAADGTRRPVIVKGHPVRHKNRRAGLFSLIDITERKVFEDLLRARADDLQQASVALKLANKKLSLLSSITRHDINNQLTGLRIYLALLEEEQADPALAVYCEKAMAAAEQIGTIVQFTREYEQIGISAPVWHDCRSMVDEAAAQALLPDRVSVHNDLPAGMEIFADPLVGRVFYNLITNAVEHGGTITAIQFYAREEYDGTAVIVCEDNGVGVPAENKERIFEMGYGKHTGLGLALAREILGITGIMISESGRPGLGARFELAVPPENCRFGEG